MHIVDVAALVHMHPLVWWWVEPAVESCGATAFGWDEPVPGGHAAHRVQHA